MMSFICWGVSQENRLKSNRFNLPCEGQDKFLRFSKKILLAEEPPDDLVVSLSLLFSKNLGEPPELLLAPTSFLTLSLLLAEEVEVVAEGENKDWE